MIQKWISIAFVVMTLSGAGNILPYGNAMDPEICDNGIDDDNDGLIDINDPDCLCEMVSLESLIPNPSFEDFSCCPDDHSQLSCASGWAQASLASTDYVNTCGYLIAANELLPFPDGEGAIAMLSGFVINNNVSEIYDEYAGACLNQTMLKDVTYKFKFHVGFLNESQSPETRFAFFGSPSCSNLPFSNLSDCPSEYPDWHILSTQTISGGDELPAWIEFTVTITPTMDINALVIGGDCGGSSNNSLNLYFLDNLRLNDASNEDFVIRDPGNPCDPDFTFAVESTSKFSYQWYKEGVALIGESSAELSQMYGEGAYQLRLINNQTQNCRIADEFEFSIPVYTTELFETVCNRGDLIYQGDTIVDAGDYEYLFSSINGCDSIVTLHVETFTNTSDISFVQILSGATYQIAGNNITDEGLHEIILRSSDGCDSTVLLQLDYIDVYIPNIFSPNGDGINDYFEVSSVAPEIEFQEMSIFDRWGNLIYQGDRWDGKVGNKMASIGVYIYVVQIRDATGHESILSNSLVLMR